MYYDIKRERLVSDAEMTRRGLPTDDMAELARLDFYPLTIEQPEYDASTQGIEPDGKPAPAPDNPLAFVQRMRVFDLLDRHKALKKAEATALRWAQETGGIITPDGIRVLTGIDDQNRISSAIQGMRDSGITEVDFKSASGWVRLSLDQLVGVAALIAEHVQACFTRERALYEAIDACVSLEAMNALDLSAGWPGAAAPEDAESEQAQDPDASGQVSADAEGSA